MSISFERVFLWVISFIADLQILSRFIRLFAPAAAGRHSWKAGDTLHEKRSRILEWVHERYFYSCLRPQAAIRGRQAILSTKKDHEFSNGSMSVDFIRLFAPAAAGRHSWKANDTIHEKKHEFSNGAMSVILIRLFAPAAAGRHSWKAGDTLHEKDHEFSNGAMSVDFIRLFAPAAAGRHSWMAGDTVHEIRSRILEWVHERYFYSCPRPQATIRGWHPSQISYRT